MIPFMLYMLVRKHGKKAVARAVFQIKNYITVSITFVFIGIIIILLSLIPKFLKSQTHKINYTILQGDHNIGWLTLESNTDGNKSTLHLISEVKTRLIFMINVLTKETSTFENGKLIYSNLFRKNNGTIKLNKQTKYTGEKYEVIENGEKESLGFSYIGNNLLSLYFKEPVGIDRLYCDNHECFIKIAKLNDGGYKANFPDGNSNSYYYHEGICTKIKIEHTFYSATIIHAPKK
jgi:hypothetical protein